MSTVCPQPRYFGRLHLWREGNYFQVSTGIVALLTKVLSVVSNLVFGTGGPEFREMRLLGGLSRINEYFLEEVTTTCSHWSDIQSGDYGRSLLCLVHSDCGLLGNFNDVSLGELLFRLLPTPELSRVEELHYDPLLDLDFLGQLRTRCSFSAVSFFVHSIELLVGPLLWCRIDSLIDCTLFLAETHWRRL